MSCEINDNPCDECEEKYCPDMLEDVQTKFKALKLTLDFHENRVSDCHKDLLDFTHEHGAVLDCSGIRPRSLTMSMTVARSDLATSIHYLPEHVRWRPLQSIRMITEDLVDQKDFKPIWERWMKDDSALPTFEKLMTKRP